MPDLRRAGAGWALLLAAFAGQAQAAGPGPACLPGSYDGGQHELAAGLGLGGDARFEYGLSYGAMDETASGTWRYRDGRILLTSDPVRPPRFAVVGQQRGRRALLRIALDLPKGISRQYFDARVLLADGRLIERQFAEDGLVIPLHRGDRPVSVTVALPLFGLLSEPFPLAGAGEMRIRFEPNDIGKVAFADTPLRFENGQLVLERHGRMLRFRPVQGGCREDQRP